MKKTIWGAIILTLFFSVGIFSVQAQEEVKEESCDDYYLTGDLSGDANYSSPENSRVFFPGEIVEFDLHIRNGSKVFIPDARIILRLEKMRVALDEESLKDEKIVKEELLLDNIALNSGEEKIIKHQLQLPEQLENGIYTVKIFPIRGMDINVGTYDFEILERSAEANKRAKFEVKNQSDGSLIFSKEGLKINGENYAGKGVEGENFENIKITQILQNLFSERKYLEVKQELFKGNYYAKENKIDSTSQDFFVEAGKEIEINYDAKDKIKKDFPLIYYLRTEISYQGGNIISTIPIFSKNSVEGSRPFLSFLPFLDKFPLKKGDRGNLAICVNRMGISGEVKIESILKDDQGNEVARLEKGDGENSRVSFEKGGFEIKKNYTSLILENKIYQNGELVDEYEVVYKNPEKFISEEVGEATYSKMYIYILFGIVGILIAGLIGWFVWRRKSQNNEKGNNNQSGMGGGMRIALFLFILAGSGFISGGKIFASNYDFSIKQVGGAVIPEAFDDEGNYEGGGLDCGGAVLTGIEAFNTNYWLRASSSKTFTRDAYGDIKFNSGVIAQGDVLDFKFLKTATNGIDKLDEYPGRSASGKQSQWFHPISPAGFAFGAMQGNLSAAFIGALGKTNFPALTGAIGLNVDTNEWNNSFLFAGLGAEMIFKLPHILESVTLTDSELAENVNCATFTPDKCRRDLCEKLGGVYNSSIFNKLSCSNLKNDALYDGFRKSACCSHATGNNNCVLVPLSHQAKCYNGLEGYGHTAAEHQAIINNQCAGIFVQGTPEGVDGCKTKQDIWDDSYDKCGAIATSCNSNNNLLSGNKSTILSKVKGTITPDRTTISSSNASVVDCTGVTGKCVFTGNPGKATLTVDLPWRGSAAVFAGLAGASFPPLQACGVNNIPLSWGVGGFLKTSYDFDVTVPGPPPTPTVYASCDNSGKIRINWTNASSLATSWNFRLDDISNNGETGVLYGWYKASSEDVLWDGISWGPAFETTGTPGKSYNTWVHACDASYGCSETAGSVSFSCPLPKTLTVVNNCVGSNVSTAKSVTGINCGTSGNDCTETYPYGTGVFLEATCPEGKTCSFNPPSEGSPSETTSAMSFEIDTNIKPISLTAASTAAAILINARMGAQVRVFYQNPAEKILAAKALGIIVDGVNVAHNTLTTTEEENNVGTFLQKIIRPVSNYINIDMPVRFGGDFWEVDAYDPSREYSFDEPTTLATISQILNNYDVVEIRAFSNDHPVLVYNYGDDALNSIIAEISNVEVISAPTYVVSAGEWRASIRKIPGESLSWAYYVMNANKTVSYNCSEPCTVVTANISATPASVASGGTSTISWNSIDPATGLATASGCWVWSNLPTDDQLYDDNSFLLGRSWWENIGTGMSNPLTEDKRFLVKCWDYATPANECIAETTVNIGCATGIMPCPTGNECASGFTCTDGCCITAPIPCGNINLFCNTNDDCALPMICGVSTSNCCGAPPPSPDDGGWQEVKPET